MERNGHNCFALECIMCGNIQIILIVSKTEGTESKEVTEWSSWQSEVENMNCHEIWEPFGIPLGHGTKQIMIFTGLRANIVTIEKRTLYKKKQHRCVVEKKAEKWTIMERRKMVLKKLDKNSNCERLTEKKVEKKRSRTNYPSKMSESAQISHPYQIA